MSRPGGGDPAVYGFHGPSAHPDRVVLEPFAGSGTTAEACVIEGFWCIAVEREATYLPLIVNRPSKPIQPDLFGGAA